MTATLITASHTDKYAIATIKTYPITAKIFPVPNKCAHKGKFSTIVHFSPLHIKAGEDSS